MYVISFLDGVFEELFYRKAKHASNRAGKMQQSAAAASLIRFFWDAPILFDVFFLLSLLFFTFPVLLAQDFGYPFLITKWCLEKTPKPEFRIFNLPKTSYLLFISHYRI